MKTKRKSHEYQNSVGDIIFYSIITIIVLTLVALIAFMIIGMF